MLSARLAKRRVRPTYTWIAPVYDLMALLVARRPRRRALAQAAVADGEDVLEIGVGTGLSFRELLRRNPGGRTEGIDATPAMLRRARRRARRQGGSGWRLRLGDAYALPFGDDTFDLVFSSYVFDLCPAADFVPLLREAGRVLRPGGRVVLLTMAEPRSRRERGWVWLYRLWPPFLGGCRPVRMAPALRAAGFRHVQRQHVVQAGFPSEVACGTWPGAGGPVAERPAAQRAGEEGDAGNG